jgi:excisionase family DNA binding protein
VSWIEISIPLESVETIARRAAELALEQLAANTYELRQLLTVGEAADYLRCSPQRIYELRSSGRLPRTREGGRALVWRSDLDHLLDAHAPSPLSGATPGR